jgi:hypothetical protein
VLLYACFQAATMTSLFRWIGMLDSVHEDE